MTGSSKPMDFVAYNDRRTAMRLPELKIDADIARAWSIPAPWYVSAEALAIEEEKIFRRTWQVVGHRSQVQSAGDYFTCELAGEPLLIVRGAGRAARFL